MKILKNNFEKEIVKEYPKKLICENCGSELEYDESDKRVGEYGCVFIDCPLCKYENELEEEGKTLTKDNIEFPMHFHHTSKETGDVTINDDGIKVWIKDCIDDLRTSNEFATSRSSGDACVIVFKFDGDENYEVIVTRNYYHTFIPFENEDYYGRA